MVIYFPTCSGVDSLCFYSGDGDSRGSVFFLLDKSSGAPIYSPDSRGKLGELASVALGNRCAFESAFGDSVLC